MNWVSDFEVWIEDKVTDCVEDKLPSVDWDDIEGMESTVNDHESRLDCGEGQLHDLNEKVNAIEKDLEGKQGVFKSVRNETLRSVCDLLQNEMKAYERNIPLNQVYVWELLNNLYEKVKAEIST